MTDPLLQFTSRGIYCAAGDFYIDPLRSVERAIITHAHSDHARAGSKRYVAHPQTATVMRVRLGKKLSIAEQGYGERLNVRGVNVSLHPSGHLPGAAQVRVEHRGQVWVASGDYKSEIDGVAAPIEVVRCHGFISESTFGLPIYRWRPQAEVLSDVHNWWAENRAVGALSIVFVYSLGKAQRLLAHLDQSAGPVLLYDTVAEVSDALRTSGVHLPEARRFSPDLPRETLGRAILLAPSSILSQDWFTSLAPYSMANASGWMLTRRARLQRGEPKGFVMSDHADWDGLNSVIRGTGAERVLVTHGFTHQLSRYLREQGIDAEAVAHQYEGDTSAAPASPGEAEESRE